MPDEHDYDAEGRQAIQEEAAGELAGAEGEPDFTYDAHRGLIRLIRTEDVERWIDNNRKHRANPNPDKHRRFEADWAAMREAEVWGHEAARAEDADGTEEPKPPSTPERLAVRGGRPPPAPPQPQAVGHYRNARQGHRRRGQNRR